MSRRWVALRSSVLLALLSCAALADEPLGKVPDGADLHTEEFFSRPLTVLEYVIANVATRARDAARTSELAKNSYRIDKSMPFGPEGNAGYDVSTGKIVIYLEIYAEHMSDPWQEACLDRLMSFYGSFFFPAKHSDSRVKLAQMRPYYGHITETDSKSALASVDRFLDSITTRVHFKVTGDRTLRFSRVCQVDNANGKAAFDEFRYPTR